MVLFFDTETTGVPKNYNGQMTDLDNWPRVIQLAWALFNDNGTLFDSQVDYCQIPGAHGFKWPKLEELHEKLFGCAFDGAHDAMNDVMATAKCYFELKNKSII